MKEVWEDRLVSLPFHGFPGESGVMETENLACLNMSSSGHVMNILIKSNFCFESCHVTECEKNMKRTNFQNILSSTKDPLLKAAI